METKATKFEEQQKYEKPDYIVFETLNCGSVRLAKNLVTKERLERLCVVNNIVIADEEGEEVIPNENGIYPNLKSSKRYTVVDEDDLKDDEDEMPGEDERVRQYRFMMKNFQKMEKMQEARKEVIKEIYKPKHPHLFTFNKNIFEPAVLELLNNPTEGAINKFLKKETQTGIYSLHLFTPQFCRELLEEVESFENSGLPIMRPNSMNNYGVILDELGFYPFFEQMREALVPLFAALYGELGAKLDDHHAFIVQYKIGEDLDLNFHYDEAEVTLNFCLGKQFTGGTLYFRGLLEKPETHNENFEFTHHPGLGIIHIGKHRHGANAIKSGERYNLIVWFRNSKLRQEHNCSHCGSHQHGH